MTGDPRSISRTRARIEERTRRTSRRRGIVCVAVGCVSALGFVGLLVLAATGHRSAGGWEWTWRLISSGGLAVWALGYGVYCLRGRMRSPESARFGRSMSWLRVLWWPWHRP
jgi:hypothetical protein